MRPQLRGILTRIRKESRASFFELVESLVVAVVENLFLEEFPESFDQVEVRSLWRQKRQLDL
jgi:hypothetical protein